MCYPEENLQVPSDIFPLFSKQLQKHSQVILYLYGEHTLLEKETKIDRVQL